MTKSNSFDSFVTCETTNNVALIKFDDKKVNVLSHETIAALHQALDQAQDEAKAVVLAGRQGVLTAGFDLKVMQKGPESAGALFAEGMALFLRLYEFPKPVVVACTGHALAAGGILLLCSDVRIGVDADVKIGFNETALGMIMPSSVLELARDRLSVHHMQSSILLARLYSPKEALDVGFLDRVLPESEVEAAALTEASELAETLSLRAFAGVRKAIRGEVAQSIRAQMAQDARKFTVGLD